MTAYRPLYIDSGKTYRLSVNDSVEVGSGLISSDSKDLSIEADAGQTINLGTANTGTIAVNIGTGDDVANITIGCLDVGAGVKTQVQVNGDLAVAGTETVTGETTFEGDATFEGAVTFGNGDPTDTVSYDAATRVITNMIFDDDVGVVFGDDSDASIQFVSASSTLKTVIPNDVASAYTIVDAVDGYKFVEIVTTDGASTEEVKIGNATENPKFTVLGSGQITLTGNVDATTGLDVTGGNLTATGGTFAFTGTDIDLDPTGTFDLAMDATKVATIHVADNLDASFLIQEGANDYIEVDTTNGSEIVNIGNATTNPDFSVLGSGQITLTGNVDANAGIDVAGGNISLTANYSLVMAESSSDPGGTANQGKVYTKDTSGITNLFYQDSAGTVTQLTGATAGYWSFDSPDLYPLSTSYHLAIGATDASTNKVLIKADAINEVTLNVQSVANQTANIFQIANSAGTPLLFVQTVSGSPTTYAQLVWGSTASSPTIIQEVSVGYANSMYITAQETSSTTHAGGKLYLTGGDVPTTGTSNVGGDVYIRGGNSSSSRAGHVYILGGESTSGTDGYIYFGSRGSGLSDTCQFYATSGNIRFQSTRNGANFYLTHSGVSSSTNGGDTQVLAQNSSFNGGIGGTAALIAGAATNATSGTGGTANVTAGAATNGTGGSVNITAGAATTGIGGSVNVVTGDGSVLDGDVIFRVGVSAVGPLLRPYTSGGASTVGSVGSSTYYWYNGYFANTYTSKLTAIGTNITLDDTITLGSSDTYSIGTSSSDKLSAVYATNGYFNDICLYDERCPFCDKEIGEGDVLFMFAYKVVEDGDETCKHCVPAHAACAIRATEEQKAEAIRKLKNCS